MPLILPGNVASATASTAYTVANSLRCDNASQTYMHRTPGSTGNRRTWTFSTWFKRSAIGATAPLMFGYFNTSSNLINIGFTSTFQLYYRDKKSGTTEIEFKSSAKYRDPSAWMHLVVAVDTTQSTEGNRVKIYINGVQVTAFATATYPDEDYDTLMNVSGYKYEVADVNTDDYWDGYLAETVLIDGSQLAPTSFGEFNSDSPTIWQPIDVSGLTFGTNGFYLDYEASDNLGNAADGGTDFTEVNFAATEQCTDTPTNNFCTLNYIHGSIRSSGGLAEGNTTYNKTSTGSGHKCTTLATMAPANGKWYYECKIGDNNDVRVGFIDTEHGAFDSNNSLWDDSGTPSWAWQDNGSRLITDATTTSHFSTYTTNDIISFAIDLDNRKVYAAKNGTWENSGDPTSGATGTGSFADLPTTTIFFSPAIGTQDKDSSSVHYLNFGNPSYANSSDAADGNGYGAFEYAPPSGYFALCTKNLAEHG